MGDHSPEAVRRDPASGATGPALPRWPAEWEPHEATWLCWPKNPETWPGLLDRVESVFARIVEALVSGEAVRILVDDEPAEAHVRACLASHAVDPDRAIEFLHVPSDDAWVRDHGPIYTVDEATGEPWLLDFVFNAWGEKYPPWSKDANVAGAIARLTGGRRRAVDAVLEGGAIDGDGRGVVLTTESCLLNPNRTPGRGARTRAEAESLLGETLGARHVVWLGDGIAGDDTDGHVDDIARFVSPNTVVAAVEPDPADVNHAPLAENLERLRAVRDPDGQRYDVVELPMPAAVLHRGVRLPASHANFYIANGLVLLPTFGGATDARAAAILREALPDRDVVAIPSSELVVGLGAVHCLTQQEPRVAAGGQTDERQWPEARRRK